MVELEWRRADDPKDWTKEDLVALARMGEKVWNDHIREWWQRVVSWNALSKAKDKIGLVIDLSDEVFEQSFEGYKFPTYVDFSRSVLKQPNFKGARFSCSRLTKEEAEKLPVEAYSKKRNEHLVSVIFFETEFLGDVVFLPKVSDLGCYFAKVTFGPDVDFFNIEVSNVVGEKTIAIHLQDWEETPRRIVLHVNADEGKSNISVRKCYLSNIHVFIDLDAASNYLYFQNNNVQDGYISLKSRSDDVKPTAIRLFENEFRGSSLNFRDIKSSKGVILYNNPKMDMNVEFNDCQIRDLRVDKCAIKSNFFYITRCKFEEGLILSETDFQFSKREDVESDDQPYGFHFTGNQLSGALSAFNTCTFDGPVNFKGSVFECPLDFAKATFTEAPDLRLTKINAHFSLDGMKVIAPKKYDAANDHEAFRDLSDRYRRLKELAITAKDHDRELDFFAEEMRTKRLGEEKWYLRLPNLLYGAVSAYGRSIARPIAALVAIWLTVGYIVMMKWRILKGQYVDWDVAWQSFKLSGSLLTPFLGLSRTVYNDMVEKLFNKEPLGFFVDTVFLLEGALGVILIFLIGLALRNRFRL